MATQSTHKQAVILMSHFFNDFIEEKYKRLIEELNPELYDVFLLLNINDKNTIKNIPAYIHCYVYDVDDLNSLGYTPIYERLLPGSCHFPVLRFYKEHRRYSFYWIIEYDVYFTAPWHILLDSYLEDQTDYLAPFIEKYNAEKNGDWHWWYIENKSGFALNDSLRTFHPICRYSSDALNCINRYQQQGYSAHSELLIPTCISHANLTLSTIDNKYFIRRKGFNSFRYRPIFQLAELEQNNEFGILYHPIKPSQI